MKRNITMASIILGILLTSIVFSCSKDESNLNSITTQKPNTTLNCEVIEGVLCFESVEDYETAIDELNKTKIEDYKNIEEQLRFTSMRSFYLAKGSYNSMPVQDDLFATLLNPDGRIKIAGKVFEIDVAAKRFILFHAILKLKKALDHHIVLMRMFYMEM